MKSVLEVRYEPPKDEARTNGSLESRVDLAEGWWPLPLTRVDRQSPHAGLWLFGEKAVLDLQIVSAFRISVADVRDLFPEAE